jgi:hypothetical protein
LVYPINKFVYDLNGIVSFGFLCRYNNRIMQADVDMSGRIEETNRPTALALANEVSVSVWISGRDKRDVIEVLRR